MNHLELESMNKQDRLTKLMKIYDRVQSWIQSNAGIVSPSDMNIAQTVLREIEELTANKLPKSAALPKVAVVK